MSERRFKVGDRVRIVAEAPGGFASELIGKYRVVEKICDGHLSSLTENKHQFRLANTNGLAGDDGYGLIYTPTEVRFIRSAAAAKKAATIQRAKKGIKKGDVVQCINDYSDFVCTGEQYTVESVSGGFVRVVGVTGGHNINRFKKIGASS